ncbi:hypothetical protein L9F63_003112, partial [Diploptera punctata]
ALGRMFERIRHYLTRYLKIVAQDINLCENPEGNRCSLKLIQDSLPRIQLEEQENRHENNGSGLIAENSGRPLIRSQLTSDWNVHPRDENTPVKNYPA